MTPDKSAPAPEGVSAQCEDRFARPFAERFAERYAAIDASLAAADAPTRRDATKADIVALFREIEAVAAKAEAAKESVKQLVARWKALDPRKASAADTTSRVMPARVDHLGASTFVEKGWSKLSLGDAAGAELAFRRALDLAPGDNDAESLLGWAQMAQEQFDHALLTFHNVLLRDPAHALARANVGYICLRKKIYGEAIEHLARAIRGTDRKATLYAHLYLGMVYREREMFDDADAFFLRALALGPNLLQAWYELGRSRWFAGRRELALDAWRQGAAANTFNPWGKRCAELVERGEQGSGPPAD